MALLEDSGKFLSSIRGTVAPETSSDDRSRMVSYHSRMSTCCERGLAGHRLCAIVHCQHRVLARSRQTHIHPEVVDVGLRECDVTSGCTFVVERVLEDKRPTA